MNFLLTVGLIMAGTPVGALLIGRYGVKTGVMAQIVFMTGLALFVAAAVK